MRQQFLGIFLLCAALGVVAIGCGGGSDGVKVTGSVTQGGKSQEGVMVGFVFSDPNQGAKGTRTNAEGTFEIMLKPGSYTVTVAKWVDKRGNVPNEEDYTQLEASGSLKQVYLAKYTSHASSPFKVEIPAEGKALGAFEVK